MSWFILEFSPCFALYFEKGCLTPTRTDYRISYASGFMEKKIDW